MNRVAVIEELYRHHYNYLFMVAYNICERIDMSEDLVQDGFIRILTAKATFMSWQDARRYTAICIKHAAFERLGRESRAQAIRRDFVRTDDPRRMKMEVRVLAAFSKMKSLANQRILKEIYFHGKTRKELARQYEVKPATITRKEKIALGELSLLFNQ